MSYSIKQLAELCDIFIGRTPARKEQKYWGKGNKWVSISDLTSKVINKTKEEITDHAVTQVRCRKVPAGTLLFSFKLTIGKMAFAGCDLYTNEAIAALHIKNKKELYAEYLFFALQVAKLLGSNQAVMGKTLNLKSDGAGKWFYQAINEIFNEFKKLDGHEINEYCQCYRANNLIGELCENSPEVSPVQYCDLNPSKKDLNTRLSDFFKKLYSSGFFGL